MRRTFACRTFCNTASSVAKEVSMPVPLEKSFSTILTARGSRVNLFSARTTSEKVPRPTNARNIYDDTSSCGREMSVWYRFFGRDATISSSSSSSLRLLVHPCEMSHQGMFMSMIKEISRNEILKPHVQLKVPFIASRELREFEQPGIFCLKIFRERTYECSSFLGESRCCANFRGCLMMEHRILKSKTQST